jgi:hypothetical protein
MHQTGQLTAKQLLGRAPFIERYSQNAQNVVFNLRISIEPETGTIFKRRSSQDNWRSSITPSIMEHLRPTDNGLPAVAITSERIVANSCVTIKPGVRHGPESALDPRYTVQLPRNMLQPMRKRRCHNELHDHSPSVSTQSRHLKRWRETNPNHHLEALDSPGDGYMRALATRAPRGRRPTGPRTRRR